MNFETAVAEVQQIVGWRSDKEAEIQRALKYAQSQREQPGRTYPWFLRQVKTIATVVGQQEYTLPTGYIQDTDEEDGNLFVYTGTGTSTNRTIFLRKMDFMEAQQKYFGSWPASNRAEFSDQSDTIDAGAPQAYVLEALTVRFYPTPDAIYSVNWKCWAADATMATGQENQWLRFAPWVLIGDAASKIGADLGNSNAVSTAQGLLARAEADLFRAVIHREEAGRRRYLGRRL
ncbi:MAG TPA: hypothetical protein VIY48_02170 [Candidatus Paceibacterota bacterium]